MSFVGSYVWKLRQALGSQRLLVPGVGMLMMNDAGELWMGKRSDSGDWSYFGGAMELGDSTLQTAVKEVEEELGLTTSEQDWTLFAIHTNPAETNYTYPNGDKVQIVNHLFTMSFNGPITGGDDEHTEFKTFALDDLPENMKPDSRHAIRLYQQFLATGQVQVN